MIFYRSRYEYCESCANANVSAMIHRHDYVRELRRVGMHKCRLNSLKILELTPQKAARVSPKISSCQSSYFNDFLTDKR
jgi:hypothetical protein